MNLLVSPPEADHRCWLQLATGNAPRFQTRQLALQLMFKRLERERISPVEKAREVYAFFVKNEKILGPEINQLSSL